MKKEIKKKNYPLRMEKSMLTYNSFIIKNKRENWNWLKLMKQLLALKCTIMDKEISKLQAVNIKITIADNQVSIA